MQYYPLYLDLTQKHILVVGAGKVGVRKALSLLKCPFESLTVQDINPCPKELANAVSTKHIVFIQKVFSSMDVADKFLVFAATNDPVINSNIAAECHKNNILCNIADAPKKSNFLVPSYIEKGPITMTISTGGASPALTKHLRTELEAWLGNRYTAFAVMLGKLRSILLAQSTQTEENSKLFRTLVQSSLAEELAAKNYKKATVTLKKMLPHELHRYIGDLIQ